MLIIAKKSLPSSKELIEILRKEFSDKYSYEQFGLGDNKSIIVKSSAFVGAQISINENFINIDGVPPSVSTSFISTILHTFLNLFIIFALLPYRILEKDIGLFLSRKYN